jgi:hypothetical protein
MPPRLTVASALAAAALTTACGGGGAERPAAAVPPPDRPLRGAHAQAPPPATAATLSRVADSPAARARLGYVDRAGLRAADLPVAAADVVARVLAPGVRSGVRVGDEVVEPGPDAAPRTSAITPPAQSAAQSCLGETLAETILGPRTMGADAALGVGLAESGDDPAGLQLRICGAPHYVRDLRATERRLERAFAGMRARIGEQEIGEREIVAATVAADDVPPARLLDLLGAGRALRDLAWHRKATRR